MKLLDMAHTLGSSHLLGLLAGKQARERLSEALSHAKSDPLVLDMKGIELVTASAARESVVQMSKDLAERGTPLFLANVNEHCRDELTFAADASKVPLLVAVAFDSDKPVRGYLIGSLESKQRETLQVVAHLGEADAKTASETAGDSGTGVTAWNNRLSGLASKGLLQERRAGKTKFYSLVMEGIVDGD